MLDKILPNGLYRVKWEDGLTSFIEEKDVRIEKDESKDYKPIDFKKHGNQDE